MKKLLAWLLTAAPVLASGFTADVPLRSPADRAALRGLDVSVENVTGGVAHVWITDEEAAALRRAGLTVRRTADGATRAHALGDSRGYHTPEQCVTDFRAWAEAHPDITRLEQIGTSVEGRPILALKVTADPDRRGFKPLVRICGAHHGNEVMSCQTVILFTKYLLENHATDPRLARLLRERELWIIPMVNPDGVARRQRHNAHGADLNRNYGYNWSGGWKSGDAPYSEPEVRAVRDHHALHPFAMSLSFHCSGDIVNYVWNYTPVRAPDQDLILELSQGYAAFNSYDVTEGFDWYETHGDTNDFSYGCRGDIDWTIEVANPSPSGIQGVFAQNRDAILYIVEQAGRGLEGVVTDAAGRPLEALVEPLPTGWPAFTHPRSGDFHRPISPGTYALRVWAPGHEAKLIENVTVPAQGAVRVDVALEARAGEHHALNVVTTIVPDSEPRNATHAPHALGPADGRAVSLGRKGLIVLDLSAAFPAGAAAKVTLHEAGVDEAESAMVSTATAIDGPWTPLGAVTGTGALDATAVQRYLRIEDAGRGEDAAATPGYDLDAVAVDAP